jgi:hypothetical protein
MLRSFEYRDGCGATYIPAGELHVRMSGFSMSVDGNRAMNRPGQAATKYEYHRSAGGEWVALATVRASERAVISREACRCPRGCSRLVYTLCPTLALALAIRSQQKLQAARRSSSTSSSSHLTGPVASPDSRRPISARASDLLRCHGPPALTYGTT